MKIKNDHNILWFYSIKTWYRPQYIVCVFEVV